MVTLVLPRLVSFEGAGRRSSSVVERNVTALRSAYWVVMATGFLEPIVYLFSIGVGVGRLVGTLTLPDGKVVAYSAFVAPAMLAASAMTGALSETTFNFFGKMKFMKLYDGILATPVRPIEIALGELAWAMLRGNIYAAAFLVVMVVMGLTSAGLAVVAFFAAALVGFAFGAAGMALSTFMRSWQDFDVVQLAVLPMFLFSATFYPVTTYPESIRWIVQLTPLYHAVALTRELALGMPGSTTLGHVAYLVALGIAGTLVAARRLERTLLT